MGVLPREERSSIFSPITLAGLRKIASSVSQTTSTQENQNQLPMRRIASQINDRYAFLKHALGESPLSHNNFILTPSRMQA